MMKEKILKILLILLIVITVVFIGFLIYENKDNSSNKDVAPKVTDNSTKLIELSDDAIDQIIDDYKFNFARLYYNDNNKNSTFLVNIYNDNYNESKKLIGIKIIFFDSNDELLYTIDVPNIEYINYPYMYSTTIDADLSKTKSIKYELEYEE